MGVGYDGRNQIKEKPKESVHVRIDCDLYNDMEKLRVLPHCKMSINRSDIYNETIFYGFRIQEIKREIGDKEFDRVWNILLKLNLKNADLGKFLGIE
jgi:hypothetical protein